MAWATAVAVFLVVLAGIVIGDTWLTRVLLALAFGLAVGLLGFLTWTTRRRITAVHDRLNARIKRVDRHASALESSLSGIAKIRDDRIPRTPLHRPTTPRVSVIVTTFNQSQFIEDALESVMAQTWDDFECVVVDARSTDRTLEKAFQKVNRDPRFSVVVLDENLGPSKARNAGLDRTRGEYVTFLDGDDFLYPKSLEERLYALTTETDRGWVAGSYCLWHSVPEDAPRASDPPELRRNRGDVTWFDAVTGAPFIVSAPLLRRDVLLAHGGFDNEVSSAEDALLWSSLMRAGWIVRCTNTVGVAYRQRRQSWYRRSRTIHSAKTEEIVRRNTQAVEEESVGPGPHKFGKSLGDLISDRVRFERTLIDIVGYVESDPTDVSLDVVGQQLEFVEPWMTRVVDVAKIVSKASIRLNRHTEGGLSVRSAELSSIVLSALSQILQIDPVSGAPLSRGDTYVRISQDTSNELGVELRTVTPSDLRPEAIEQGSVLLLPSAAYHLDEILPLASELKQRGLKSHILVSSMRWKNVSTGIREADDIPVATYDPKAFISHDEIVARSSAVVTMNDWGEDRPFVVKARESGVPGFAKVEGVQDFEDDDIDRVRLAYQSAEFILAQGDNDVRNTRPAAYLVGSSRLERIWRGPPTLAKSPRAVINLNFTYGVLNDARDRWLETAVAACELENIPFVVSLHPAERSAIADRYPVAEEPIRHELTNATVLISRFSTVPFEAMARGVPFIYHNPHGERVPTFSDPQGAFPISTSVHELRSGLRAVSNWVGTYRSQAENFFRAQVDIDANRPSEARTADIIASFVLGRPMAPDRPAIVTPSRHTTV